MAVTAALPAFSSCKLCLYSGSGTSAVLLTGFPISRLVAYHMHTCRLFSKGMEQLAACCTAVLPTLSPPA
jgi:hypothetical protein